MVNVRRTWWIAGLLVTLGCAAPENPEARYQNTVRARACFESGDLKRAQALLSDLADESRDPVAWSNLALVLSRRDKQAGADRAWRAALRLDPQCVRAQYGLGRAAQVRARRLSHELQSSGSEKKRAAATQSMEGAVAALEAAAAADPGSPAILAALASVYDDAGRTDAATKARTGLAQLDPVGILAVSEAADLGNVQLPARPRSAGSGAIPVRFRRQPLDVHAAGVMAGDVDGDGLADLVLAGSGNALRADSVRGTVHFTAQPFLAGAVARRAVTLLADRDDTPDVVVVAASVAETASEIPAAAAGKPAAVKPAAVKPAAGPVNRSSIWLVRGGSSPAQLLGSIEFEVRALRAVDVDRDGHTDLVAAVNVAPGVRIWRNDGNGQFDFVAATRGLENTPPLRDIVCGDFTGDQRADFVAADAAGRLRVLAQAGDGSFTDASRVANLNLERTRVLDAADVDADGALDLLLGNDAGLWVLGNRGNARFVRLAAYRVPQTRWSGELPPRVPVAAILRFDFDNDGCEDVMTLHPAGAPSPAVVVAAVANPAAGAAATEDAAPELPVPVLVAPCAVTVWRNTGRGFFVADNSVEAHGVDLLSGPVAVADLDSDGDLDFAGAGADSTVAVYWNDGGNKNRRLQVDLTGGRGLHDGLGAVLEIHAGLRATVTTVHTQPLWVGVAGDTELDVVRVVWPDGGVQNLRNARVPTTGALHIERNSSHE